MIAKGLSLALLLASTFARQPGLPLAPGFALEPPDKELVDQELYREILSPYEPHYLQYDDSPKVYVSRGDLFRLQPARDDLLSKEIALLKRWEGLSQIASDSNTLDNQERSLLLLARLVGLDYRTPKTNRKKSNNEVLNNVGRDKQINEQFNEQVNIVKEKDITLNEKDKEIADKDGNGKTEEEIELESLQKEDRKKHFALTPLDEGYFDSVVIPGEVRAQMSKNELLEPRKIRQNPNLSRAKTLVAENLDELRLGLANKVYRIPVSLLPTNLRVLKISQPKDYEESTDKDTGSTLRPQNIHVIESLTPQQSPSIYSNALLAAVIAALSMAVVGLVFGWFTLSKKAKAAADVDYPAYGVTGPTMDQSGDRKLAHSAHMYHYQHQKQQILAMESCLGRNGSVSDPDSEEENEEGDYTVYECPGFATTGNMEVKNPLFSDDPTPATPGKCDVVQPQPKE
ncbi:protein cab-1 isoform X2 [Pieris rapae]|uniref:protein cab-1 isoform X2 n=1 Tax=Pieris rapae TaxID=64459 RepID=UPI001E27E280|nr:protein cab-1 isoform X2 [Pieris rapae]